MLSKAQWILTQKEIHGFQKEKSEIYTKFQWELGDEQNVIKAHMNQFISFLRARKHQPELPFKIQKVIYYAIALFKRFFLVNSYYSAELGQTILCAMYTSLKCNEFDANFITKIAKKVIEKGLFVKPSEKLLNYGDEGYTAKELQFLAGIGFQTSLSKIIHPIQAMFYEINKRAPKKQVQIQQPQQNGVSATDRSLDYYGLLPYIFKTLKRLYNHPTLIFLYDGPKLAMMVMVYVIRKKGRPLEIMGPEIEEMANANIKQIDQIIDALDLCDEGGKSDKNMEKLLKFKKPDPKKPSQSPKFQPRHESL